MYIPLRSKRAQAQCCESTTGDIYIFLLGVYGGNYLSEEATMMHDGIKATASVSLGSQQNLEEGAKISKTNRPLLNQHRDKARLCSY